MLGGAGVVIYKHTPSLSVRSFWLRHRVVMITSELRKFIAGPGEGYAIRMETDQE